MERKEKISSSVIKFTKREREALASVHEHSGIYQCAFSISFVSFSIASTFYVYSNRFAFIETRLYVGVHERTDRETNLNTSDYGKEE